MGKEASGCCFYGVCMSLVGEVVRGNKKLDGVDVGDLRDRLRGGCESVVNAIALACNCQ